MYEVVIQEYDNSKGEYVFSYDDPFDDIKETVFCKCDELGKAVHVRDQLINENNLAKNKIGLDRLTSVYIRKTPSEQIIGETKLQINIHHQPKGGNMPCGSKKDGKKKPTKKK